MFALKLGYSETLLQKALMKLGHNAEENQVRETANYMLGLRSSVAEEVDSYVILEP